MTDRFLHSAVSAQTLEHPQANRAYMRRIPLLPNPQPKHAILRPANMTAVENYFIFHVYGAGIWRAARVWLLRFSHQS